MSPAQVDQEEQLRRPEPKKYWWPFARTSRTTVSSSGIGLILTLLSTRSLQLGVGPGLDSSWQAALHVAAKTGIDYGSDLVFSYGPLGYLAFPLLYYPSTALLSAAYVFGVQLTLCICLVHLIRGSWRLPIAVVATFLIARAARLTGVDIGVIALTFVLCVQLLRGDWSPGVHRWVVRMLSLAAGIHLLLKMNTGTTMIAMVGLICLVTLDRRLILEAAGFSGLGAIVAWLFSGNHLLDLPAFILLSFQFVTGYSEGMGYEDPTSRGTLQPRPSL